MDAMRGKRIWKILSAITVQVLMSNMILSKRVSRLNDSGSMRDAMMLVSTNMAMIVGNWGEFSIKRNWLRVMPDVIQTVASKSHWQCRADSNAECDEHTHAGKGDEE